MSRTTIDSPEGEGVSLGLDSPQDSLRKRFGYKLGVSILSWPLNFSIQLMVSRGLGPVGFGSYSYLSSFFTNVLGFFDSGSSLGFYAMLCGRPREEGLKSFYWLFAFIVAVGTVLLTLLLISIGLREQFWPGQPVGWILLAVAFAIATWFVGIGEKIIDAHALNVRGEPTRLAVKAVGALALAALFVLGRLGVTTFLLCQIGLLGLQLLLWQRILKQSGYSMGFQRCLSPAEIVRYTGEFWAYSYPLLTYSLVSILGALVDRWLLQYFGGGEQQGFYSLALQVGAFCFLFTSAMVPLLSREFSEAQATRDMARMSATFRSHLPRFYSMAAFGGVFLAFQAEHVAVIVGGVKYAGAALPMALMCLYPIHQTYGQLSGAVFYATGRTALYRNIGIINTIIGLVLSYFLLAPSRDGGAGMGSAGMAYKMVVVQVVAINIQLWYNCRWLKVSFGWFLGHQILIIVVFGLLAAGAKAIGSLGGPSILGELIFAGLVYGGLVAAVGWIWPGLFGVTREHLFWIRKRAGEFLRKRSNSAVK